MLKSKLIIGLVVSVLILLLVSENEVEAAPEPCADFFRILKRKQPKDDEKIKEEEKKRKERKKKEKLKLIEKFFEDLLLPWGPSWRTREVENINPLDATVGNYVKFLSNMFMY